MLSIIVAVAENNVIGRDNKLIWHLSDDLKRFKKITSNHTILMGKKSFESLPGILPNRLHIVLTRDKEYKVDSDMVKVVHSVDEIINEYKNSSEEVFIIGGGEIYSLLLPHADKFYLTKVKESFEGDTYFPQIDNKDWKVINRSGDIIDQKCGLKYEFIDMIRL